MLALRFSQPRRPNAVFWLSSMNSSNEPGAWRSGVAAPCLFSPAIVSRRSWAFLHLAYVKILRFPTDTVDARQLKIFQLPPFPVSCSFRSSLICRSLRGQSWKFFLRWGYLLANSGGLSNPHHIRNLLPPPRSLQCPFHRLRRGSHGPSCPPLRRLHGPRCSPLHPIHGPQCPPLYCRCRRERRHPPTPTPPPGPTPRPRAPRTARALASQPTPHTLHRPPPAPTATHLHTALSPRPHRPQPDPTVTRLHTALSPQPHLTLSLWAITTIGGASLRRRDLQRLHRLRTWSIRRLRRSRTTWTFIRTR